MITSKNKLSFTVFFLQTIVLVYNRHLNLTFVYTLQIKACLKCVFLVDLTVNILLELQPSQRTFYNFSFPLLDPCLL